MIRFKADGPAIPNILLDERDAGNVVFLCGAGVSIPAGMPNFLELAQHVTDEVDPPSNSVVRQALQTYDDTDSPVAEWYRPSLDRIFQMLYQEYGRDQVVKIVWKKLNEPPKSQRHHGLIGRLSANAEGHPQIVTTNFDRLFEPALGERGPRYQPPMYPDLRRVPATGITYLHGRLADPKSDSHNYILSSAELGRAYLAEGWAAKFVRDLLERHTVVLLGYQADDPPVNYLLQGLESVGQQTPNRLFAFDKGDPEDVDAKWKARGVKAIPYGDSHETLWDTLEAGRVRGQPGGVEECRRAIECERTSEIGAPRERNGRPFGQQHDRRQGIRQRATHAAGGVVVCIRCVVPICEARERLRQVPAAVRSSRHIWPR